MYSQSAFASAFIVPLPFETYMFITSPITDHSSVSLRVYPSRHEEQSSNIRVVMFTIVVCILTFFIVLNAFAS